MWQPDTGCQHRQSVEEIPALRQPVQCGALEPGGGENGPCHVSWPDAGCQNMGRVMGLSCGDSRERLVVVVGNPVGTYTQ